MPWGVIRMYWILEELRADPMIMLVLTLRFAWSMKTSYSSRLGRVRAVFGNLYHRMGHSIDSHSANSRQMVEKDFSPPERDLGSRFLPAVCSWPLALTWRQLGSQDGLLSASMFGRRG